MVNLIKKCFKEEGNVGQIKNNLTFEHRFVQGGLNTLPCNTGERYGCLVIFTPAAGVQDRLQNLPSTMLHAF